MQSVDDITQRITTIKRLNKVSDPTGKRLIALPLSMTESIPH